MEFWLTVFEAIPVEEIIRVAGMSGYHTSVIVDNMEYFFDAIGILQAPPLFSHTMNEAKNPDGSKTVVTFVGYSHFDGRAMVETLNAFFERGPDQREVTLLAQLQCL